MAYISCRTCKYSFSIYNNRTGYIYAQCKEKLESLCLPRNYDYYKPKEKVRMEWPKTQFLSEGDMEIV